MVTRYLHQGFRSAGYTLSCLLCVYGLISVSSAAEITTLFTTPQERQLINANRYVNESSKEQLTNKSQNEGIKRLLEQEVIKPLEITGFTISNEGSNTVWINNQAYQDGEKIEGQNRIKILLGKQIRVRITTPDGKHYFGSSGETIEVSFTEDSKS